MKPRSLFMSFLLLGFLFLLVTSCAVKGVQKEVVVAPGAPAPNADALWKYITKDSPYTKWRFWPGKEAFYKGTAPHGALLTLYVNFEALDSAIRQAKVMANGSILVKENYLPNKKLLSITVMYKVEGCDADHGDWFWVKYTPKGRALIAGSPPLCIKCHRERKRSDYIMTENTG